MTSDRVYVRTWRTDREDPVVAGARPGRRPAPLRLRPQLLERPDAVRLYLPELPLQPGDQPPPDGMDLAGCLVDGAPDAGVAESSCDASTPATAATSTRPRCRPSPICSSQAPTGSARTTSRAPPGPTSSRDTDATLEQLLTAADRLQAGEPFSEDIDRVLNAGSSVGGARPKATVTAADGRALIAKFSTPTDTYPVVKGEAVAMELGRRAGRNVAATERVTVLDRDVLLVDRFDRIPGTRRRRALVSALTLLSLGEMHARYATYPDLAQTIRTRFA